MAAGDRAVGAEGDISRSAIATGDGAQANTGTNIVAPTINVTVAASAPTPSPAPPTAPIGNIPTRSRPYEGREAELDWLRAQLIDGQQPHVVIHGQPGVGKSELAREFARRHRADFPGGCFFLDMTGGDAPLDLLTIARQQLQMPLPDGLPVQEQCQTVLLALARLQALLIFDNASDPSVVDRWLPPHGSACRVLVTSTRDVWTDGRPHRQLLPLNRAEAGRLVRSIAGSVTDAQADAVLAQADGLPVQLAPAAAALGKSLRRVGMEAKGLGVMPETLGSFERALAAASYAARLMLHAMGRCNAQGTPREFIERMMGEALGWSVKDVHKGLNDCAELYLLDLGETVRWHQLLGQYLREVMPEGAEAARLLEWQWQTLVATAETVQDNPTLSDQVGILRAFTLAPDHWQEQGLTWQAGVLRSIGGALLEVGQFGLALPWYEQSVLAARKPDADGRVDQESVGRSLHLIGLCHSRQGRYNEALPWYQQAVATKKQGHINGRVDQQSVGRSLHQVGLCHSSLGRYDSALPLYQQAVAALRQGDINGRVDQDSLGSSLHEIGLCYSRRGRHGDALPCYEQAVVAKRQGNIRGRVDQGTLGTSLHEVGFCHSSQGRHDEALSWYQQAVEATRQGDIHGRVDQNGLGRSLHQVGLCYSRQGRYDDAVPWYQQAVEAGRNGDIHRRVDQDGVGRSLHEIGFCHSRQGRYDDALPWYQHALAAKRQGNIHGRVDQDSIGISLFMLAECMLDLGRPSAAKDLLIEALAAVEKGDVFGRVNDEVVQAVRARLATFSG